MSTAIDFDVAFPTIRAAVLRLLGLDLDAYKSKQLARRLTSFMERTGTMDAAEFVRRLTRDAALLEQFRDHMTINVSEFFRDPDRFSDLETRVLPELLASRKPLRIWSAGCSHGAEIYSVVMILDRLAPGTECDLLATDIDRGIIARAVRGVYPERDVKSVPDAYRRHLRTTPEGVEVSERIRGRVRFMTHNLLSDPCPADVDLLLCRNVVIYFTREAKDSLYRRFSEVLTPGGYLFAGATETMFDAKSLGFVSRGPCFYQKPSH